MIKGNPFLSEESIELLIDNKEIILYNDDVNTFDFVINTLIELCGHDSIQAEQCAFIVHFSGKCAVKSGDFEEIRPIYQEMINRKLSVEIK